ncbi:MAG: glycosyltransferase family 39 protein [Thaumarchaeota archaeon]|nr:glycosyltransferase family 39 protein [Nitrososphaerota archaeon]
MKLPALAISKSSYVIPIILFLCSFFIYGYNLAGQPWHGDEITYLGWGGNYFNLIAKGDLNNPCLISLDNCNLLFHIPAFGLTYSPLRNIMIGLPMYLVHQESGNFYNWSCYWDCYDHNESPTVQEMTAGRLFSPLFGSLSIVFSFLIGKNLFNKNVGILVSLLFMFYDLWMWYSRTIMVEVHYVFFALLSALLLLYTFKGERPRFTYFILSAIVFGVALNSKMLAVSFSGLFFALILFKGLSCYRSNLTKKKYLAKTCLMILSFFLMSSLGMFLVQPGFYQNPINEIKTIKADMDNYNHDVWYIGYPTAQNLQPKSLLSIFHYVVFPSFIEKQISDPSLNLNGNFGWTFPPTYSSIPMTVFFFAGFGCIIYRTVKSKNLISGEMLLIVWFSSTLVLTLVIVKDFSLERYLLPLETSIIFIASYGAWNFTKNLQNNKLKVVFASCLIFVHSSTALLYWEKIYFSPGTTWVNPLHYGTLQDSLDNPITFVINALFVCYLTVMLAFWSQKSIRAKIRQAE